MSSESNAQQRALSGLLLIEDAILELLSENLQGLRNSDIARMLNLQSDFRGRQRNYPTYSVLGGLLANDQVSRDDETRLFTSNPSVSLENRQAT